MEMRALRGPVPKDSITRDFQAHAAVSALSQVRMAVKMAFASVAHVHPKRWNGPAPSANTDKCATFHQNGKRVTPVETMILIMKQK
ncbi:hypothetical protein SGGMMB4_03680 [Sodalis glossinidius str. 'morsitans']|uniref:Uncharacterized protein n=1 Tax=Sodalis glossinidius (strain morsitans) TaxID=343509 RepID=A0A193QL90_SODGM|nr:hypothetical protein SGGMMB4_03680 [Sodalis glossinidius str. 'morsitans']